MHQCQSPNMSVCCGNTGLAKAKWESGKLIFPHCRKRNRTNMNASRRNFLQKMGCGTLALTGAMLGAGLLPFMRFSNARAEEHMSKKILVVYFSVPETTSSYNMNRHEENSTVVIDGKVLGNTQYVAMLIQEMSGADIFRIEPVNPYPMSHSELLDIAEHEHDSGTRPAIQNTIADFAGYDIIFIGYPNWYADMPMIMYTFLEEYDFNGKTIIPFCTHGGSGFSRTIQAIANAARGANVLKNGFAISRSHMDEARFGIAEWLKELGLFRE